MSGEPEDRGADEDLPVDDTFVPLPPVVEIEVDTGIPGAPPALAMGMTLPAEDQRRIAHNRARYAELQALRLGQPNRYHQTRYR